MILEKCREFDVPVYQHFIDFKQAYDSFNRERLWTVLVSMEIPGKLVALCRMSIQNSQCGVGVENEISKIFKVDSGVRQGDAISPMLFYLALEYVFRQKKLSINNNILSTNSVQMIAYADDVVIISRAESGLNETLMLLEGGARQIGLEINFDKTKCMKVSRGLKREDLMCGDKKVEGIESFKYLGSMVDSNNSILTDIKARIIAGTRTFFSLKPFLRSPYLSTCTKLELYMTLIRPVVVYGSQSFIFIQSRSMMENIGPDTISKLAPS
jgi:hypothetical protein